MKRTTTFKKAVLVRVSPARAGFSDDLVARKLDGQRWRVHVPFTYHVGDEYSQETITVPAGFETDLASVPRCAWHVFPTDDGYAQAAVLHDWLCHNRGKVERRYSVRRASEIFREAMEVLGISRWRRAVMFRAVLWFGPQWDGPEAAF